MALDPINFDPNWDRTGPPPPGYHYLPGSRIVEPNDPGLPPGWVPIPPAPGYTPPPATTPPPSPVVPPGPQPGYVPPGWVKAAPYDPQARNFFDIPGQPRQSWTDFLAAKGLWGGAPMAPGQTGYNTYMRQIHSPTDVQQAFYQAHPDIAYSRVVDAFGGVDTAFGRYAQQHFKQLFDRYNVASTNDPTLQWTDYLNKNADALKSQFDAGSRTERGLNAVSPFAPNGGRWLG